MTKVSASDNDVQTSHEQAGDAHVTPARMVWNSVRPWHVAVLAALVVAALGYRIEGATPKDGPSAGVGMCTALVSALTNIPVKADVAMTGEITLRGEVLPIGGLKEKLLAAHRGGITTVLIPHENEKDLAEIPKNIKDKLTILPVKWIDEVLELALIHLPVPDAKSGDKKEKSVESSKEQKSTDIARPH